MQLNKSRQQNRTNDELRKQNYRRLARLLQNPCVQRVSKLKHAAREVTQHCATERHEFLNHGDFLNCCECSQSEHLSDMQT